MAPTVSPVLAQDERQLFDVYCQAFTSHTAWRLMYQHADVEDHFEHFRKGFRGYEVYKVEDDCEDATTGKTSRKIVAFSIWKFVSDPEAVAEITRRETADKEKKKGTPEEEPPHPKGANVEVCDVFFKEIIEKQRALVAGQKCAILSWLGVSPHHQRRGHGELLLREGILLAKQKQIPMAWLEATPAGRPLYEKYGYETVDTRFFDLAPYGINEVIPFYGMKKQISN